MTILLICSIILFVLMIINKRISKYIIVIINFIIITVIIYYYHNHLISIDTFKFINHNIYFYFLNSIVYLILFSVLLFKYNKQRLIYNIIYCITLCLLSFALFMTHYLHNNTLIVIGNIYPMVVIGNYLYFFCYFSFILKILSFLTKKK